jgi:hypothetical protein
VSSAVATRDALIDLCPDFTAWWADEEYFRTEDDGSFGVHGVIAVFSHFVAARLSQEPTEELQRIFEFVEAGLTVDGSDLDNALCTCFLENLMNRVPETIEAARLVPLLGPKARRFCRAYDEWCGTTTEGLS